VVAMGQSQVQCWITAFTAITALGGESCDLEANSLNTPNERYGCFVLGFE
jgi:hypothetical protein